MPFCVLIVKEYLVSSHSNKTLKVSNLKGTTLNGCCMDMHLCICNDMISWIWYKKKINACQRHLSTNL